MLDPGRRGNWLSGFATAQQGGAGVAGVLGDIVKQESHSKRRLLQLAALSLAGGREGEQFLVQWATSERRGEERLLALLGLALLAAPEVPTEPLLRLGSANEDEALVVAALLALGRASPRPALPEALLATRSPGILAAALLAAPAEGWGRQGSALLDQCLQEKGGANHAPLVLRAWFLAPQPPLAGQRAARAREVLSAGAAGSNLGTQELREAAALFLADSVAAEAATGGLPTPLAADCLAIMASAPRLRERLAAAGLAGGIPTLLARPGLRPRLALLYASHVAWPQVVAAAAAWQAEREVAEVVVLGLAHRLLASPPATVPGLALGGLPATVRPWLEFASARPMSPAESSADAELDRALGLAQRGRLDRDAARAVLEASLARRGAHPGLARAEAWRALVRDLLLRGSRHGESRFGKGGEGPVYFARGVPADREDCFEVACALFEFVSARVPELSPGSGLR